MNGFALGELASQLGGELVGDATLRVDRLGSLESAIPSTLSFIAADRYRAQLETTRAGCIVVAPALREAAAARGAAIVTPDPHLYFARLSHWWAARTRPRPQPGVHPSAQVHPQAQVDASASIGPLCVIEEGARIGARAVLGAHCVVGAGATIGDDTTLAARVCFGAGCRIGARGLIHSGAVIGADGFGFAPHEGAWIKVEQFGAVRIGDDVEIGANSCIDRGALDDTVIADGVKIDNQVQVGHNVRIGAHTAIAGCVGIAGSTTIGAYCTLAGAVGVSGHLTLADHVHIGPFTGVIQSITRPGAYVGIFPIDENANWEKNAATLRHLYSLRNRLRALEKKSSWSAMDIHHILKKLPHRYPFLLVDRVLEVVPDVRIRALKNVTINEPFFGGHFPARPVMPGVLMLEAMAQTAALLTFSSQGEEAGDGRLYYFVGIDGARFKRPVEPGDQLVMEAELLRAKSGIFKYRTRATVDGALAVEAELMCTVRDRD